MSAACNDQWGSIWLIFHHPRAHQSYKDEAETQAWPFYWVTCACSAACSPVRLGALGKALERKTPQKPIQTLRPKNNQQIRGGLWNNCVLQNFKVILNSCSLVTDSSPPPPFHFSCHSTNSMWKHWKKIRILNS